MEAGNILLGTSGWTYDHWREVFYPQSVPKKRWFEYFAEHFNTVELNASFYRIPTIKAVQSWQNRSPENFCFSIKMSRLITHVRKLKNCEREIEWFFSVFEPLKEKIGIFLIQLPPNMKFDSERLREFTCYLPAKFRYAFEFRNVSWYREETYQLLKDHKYAFCVHDMGELSTERIVTTDTVYIRFHGFDTRYGGDYPSEILRNWAKWILDQRNDGKRVFGFFNNDIGGFAVKNCFTLREMTGTAGV